MQALRGAGAEIAYRVRHKEGTYVVMTKAEAVNRHVRSLNATMREDMIQRRAAQVMTRERPGLRFRSLSADQQARALEGVLLTKKQLTLKPEERRKTVEALLLREEILARQARSVMREFRPDLKFGRLSPKGQRKALELELLTKKERMLYFFSPGKRRAAVERALLARSSFDLDVTFTAEAENTIARDLGASPGIGLDRKDAPGDVMAAIRAGRSHYDGPEQVREDVLRMKKAGILSDVFIHMLTMTGVDEGLIDWMESEGIEVDIKSKYPLR